MSTAAYERGPYIGSMLRSAVDEVRARIYDAALGAGFADLGRAHVAMFRNPSPDGKRPSEIADDLQIAKQSVNDLLGDLEARGYLVRVADPTDGRARVVRLTERGHRLQSVAFDAAERFEQDIAELLGPERFPEFRAAVVEIAEALRRRRAGR